MLLRKFKFDAFKRLKNNYYYNKDVMSLDKLKEQLSVLTKMGKRFTSVLTSFNIFMLRFLNVVCGGVLLFVYYKIYFKDSDVTNITLYCLWSIFILLHGLRYISMRNRKEFQTFIKDEYYDLSNDIENQINAITQELRELHPDIKELLDSKKTSKNAVNTIILFLKNPYP